MGRKPSAPSSHDAKPAGSLDGFACPNPECSHFNRFDAANLCVGVHPASRAWRQSHASNLGRGARRGANFGPQMRKASENCAIIVMDYQRSQPCENRTDPTACYENTAGSR